MVVPISGWPQNQNNPSARPQTVILQPQWHAWRPAGLRSHLDQKILIFYCKYWCLSSQPGVSSWRDESKCHQVLVFSDQNEWASCGNSPATASLGLLKIRQNPSVQALFGELSSKANLWSSVCVAFDWFWSSHLHQHLKFWTLKDSSDDGFERNIESEACRNM